MPSSCELAYSSVTVSEHQTSTSVSANHGRKKGKSIINDGNKGKQVSLKSHEVPLLNRKARLSCQEQRQKFIVLFLIATEEATA